MVQPEGCFGLMGFASKGKDSLIGHWEIAGCPIETPSGVSDEAIPDLVVLIEGAIGQKTLGNRKMSGANPVEEMSVQHRGPACPSCGLMTLGPFISRRTKRSSPLRNSTG